MNILVLCNSFAPEIGGIETHTRIMAAAWQKKGYAVCVVTLTPNDQEDHYPFTVLRQPDTVTLLKWYKWANLVFENHPVRRLSIWNVWFRRPRIVTLHTWLYHPDKQPLSRTEKWRKFWVNKADLIITVSNALLDKTKGVKAKVIPNPYEDAIFRVDTSIIRTKPFVYLGRLVSDKGVAIALKAIAILLKSSQLSAAQKKTIRLTIIGDGPEKAQLRSYATELGIADKIDFLGILTGKRLVSELNRHEAIIVPSLWEEPFGMVALEAMACGCIPIASNSGGLSEAIGDAGLLFERGNSNELAQQMIRLLQDQLLQQKLRMNAQNHLARHSTEQIASQYAACIENFRKAKRPSHL